jgi:hypothetical protein
MESAGAPAIRRGKHGPPAGVDGTRLSFQLCERTLPALRLRPVFTGTRSPRLEGAPPLSTRPVETPPVVRNGRQDSLLCQHQTCGGPTAASGPVPFERGDCRRRDRRHGVNRTRSVTVAQLTELRGSQTSRWRARFSTTSDRSAGSNAPGRTRFAPEDAPHSRGRRADHQPTTPPASQNISLSKAATDPTAVLVASRGSSRT